MIINSQKKIDFFKRYFAKKNFICVDTEFERKKTYYSKLSIVTVSDGKKFFIFDILEDPKLLNILKELFKSKKLLKILHGSSQDIEIFLNHKVNIEPFFDTQIAAGFMGLDKNISYANIVKKLLKKKIDKTNQNMNWLKRPIVKSQINYLKKDVLYLKKIHDFQLKNLMKFKKISFAREEFDTLIKNIKNSKGINSKFKKKLGFQIYENKEFLKILEIRDKKSKIKNLPKNWILKDENIISIIKNKKFDTIKKNKYFSDNEKKDIIKFFKKVLKIKFKKINNEIEIKCLEFFRYLVSKKYSIDVSLIASKYDLINYKRIKNNSKWRNKIFFDLYEKIISGKKKFVLNNFKL
tara:strand:+ start:2678 stop:3730 length:1053 start_codon:yes stop_codon:yes gene_type:complete